MSLRVAVPPKKRPSNRLEHVLQVGWAWPWSTKKELEHPGRAPNFRDAETIGLQGFPDLGIDPIADSYDGLAHTCCHLAMDKPTRLPGDYVFGSNHIESVDTNMEIVSAPLLKIKDANDMYETHLKKRDAEELMPAAKAYLERVREAFPNDKVYSDHVQVKRTINGIDVYSTNASFVVLNRVASPKKVIPPESPLWGSEKLYVMAAMQNGLLPDLFQQFMNKYTPEVVAVQEATDEYLSMYMAKPENHADTSCFYCSSGIEGSAIIVKSKFVSDTWKNGRNYWFDDTFRYNYAVGMEIDSFVWSVCGKKGRAFSAVVLCLGDQDILMLNMHSPNPAVDETLADTVPPFDKWTHKEYRRKAFSRQNEWLQMLLTDSNVAAKNSVVEKIQSEYQRCEKRLILAGDFNDASRLYITY